MPIHYHYDPSKQALFGRGYGELTREEYNEMLRAVVSSNEHPPNIRTLWDLRDLDFEKITTLFEEQLVGIRLTFPERHPTRMAFVVGDNLGFGMTRMFEALGSKVEDVTRVFRDMNEAECWLLQEPE